MSPKHFIGLGIILLAAVAVAVMVREESPRTAQSPTATPPPSEAAPSKENVSSSVRETITHLRELVKNDPTNTRNILELARMLQNAHNTQEAADYYAKGLALGGGNDSARIDYSLCLFEMGRIKESLEQNRIVLRRNPRNSQALYNIGAIHANTGARDSAEVYWRRLISMHPSNELALRAQRNLESLKAHVPVP